MRYKTQGVHLLQTYCELAIFNIVCIAYCNSKHSGSSSYYLDRKTQRCLQTLTYFLMCIGDSNTLLQRPFKSVHHQYANPNSLLCIQKNLKVSLILVTFVRVLQVSYQTCIWSFPLWAGALPSIPCQFSDLLMETHSPSPFTSTLWWLLL